MKVTQVAICPSEASQRAGRPALTPELLAASGARYSRNNEGLEAILAKIDQSNLEKSVDSIFKMVDYGHQSIADMVPVAMFIDGISIWMAYYIWSLCPTAGGQESSTRYLKIAQDGLIPPDQLGIASAQKSAWRQQMEQAFHAYQVALEVWEDVVRQNPSATGIPSSLLQAADEASRKKVARMQRNFAFDRARYFLPVAAATNVMLIMSARSWVSLCQHLLSHVLPEPRQLGELTRSELQISAPRMLKHARCTEAHQQAQADEFLRLVQSATRSPFGTDAASSRSGEAYLDALLPGELSPDDLAGSLTYHVNRYAPIGPALQRIAVRFGWKAMAFAEIRDLNRHRTGTKYCPLVPQGFYHALDQLPARPDFESPRARLQQAAQVGQAATQETLRRLQASDPAYVYWSLLGTEYPFEHVTTADKFIYEAELRTGLGAHFRYAKHLRDALALWSRRFPETRKHILEGSAEPE